MLLSFMASERSTLPQRDSNGPGACFRIWKSAHSYGSYLGEISSAPENLINRDFHAVAPNEKWLTDITEFQIPAGKVYLSPMIDCFDGLVISWTIGTRTDPDLVNTIACLGGTLGYAM